jgi:hypothetical protein
MAIDSIASAALFFHRKGGTVYTVPKAIPSVYNLKIKGGKQAYTRPKPPMPVPATRIHARSVDICQK